jgi:hypothetical protein
MSDRGAIHSSVSRAITPGFLPLKEAATWAGISTKTLQRWVERGLPKYQARPGSKVLIRPGDIEEFLTRQKVVQPELNGLVDEVMKDLFR